MTIKELFDQELTNKSLMLYLRNSELQQELINLTNFLPETVSISERAYCYKNHITSVPLCKCGKPLRFHKMDKGYFATCGDKACKVANVIKSNKERDYTESVIKAKETYKAKTGYEHPMQNPEFKKEFFDAIEKKTGERYVIASEKAKVAREKVFQEKYGTTEVGKILHSDTAKQTIIKKYGSINNFYAQRGKIKHENAISQHPDNYIALQLQAYKERYQQNDISSRSISSLVKNSIELQQELIKYTSFLNNYDVDILERLYHYLNDYNTPLLCPVCNKNLRTWTGRFKEGYRATCNCKSCKNMSRSQFMTGKTDISENRDNKFKEWQKTITLVTDDIIKENIKYDKYLDLIDNSNIIDYLNNRYNDSDSLLESLQRIRMGIEEKPLCPKCGMPVKWVGKESKMFTKYCSNGCRANAEETHEKAKQTLIEKWGTSGCYDSSIYRQYLKDTIGRETWANNESIEKRKQSFIDHYGTDKISEIPEILRKREETCLKKYGFKNQMQNPDIKAKAIETFNKSSNKKYGTSKPEKEWKTKLEEYYPSLIWHYYNKKKYPYNVDFYIPEKDIYIEYQGSQYHHYEPFVNSDEQQDELARLYELAEASPKNEKGTNMYFEIIKVWTVTDPSKRRFAKKNNIKLIEIWPDDNIDKILEEIEKFSKNIF